VPIVETLTASNIGRLSSDLFARGEVKQYRMYRLDGWNKFSALRDKKLPNSRLSEFNSAPKCAARSISNGTRTLLLAELVEIL
jgi:hypothetical protein